MADVEPEYQGPPHQWVCCGSTVRDYPDGRREVDLPPHIAEIAFRDRRYARAVAGLVERYFSPIDGVIRDGGDRPWRPL